MVTEKNFSNDNLSDYEKTIYSLAIAFGARGSHIINEPDIENIALLLSVDYQLLNKALKLCKNEIFPLKIKFNNDIYTLNNSNYADLFHALVIIYFIYKSLENLSDDLSYNSILNNYQIFKSCIGEFHFLNAITSTFECMYKNYYTLDFAVFNNSNYNPNAQVDLISIFLSCNDIKIFDENFLLLMYRIINYELITRVNSIYLITIAQIIKHSDFISKNIKEIAKEMYDYLLGIAQNARIISVQTNFLPPLNSEYPENRGKNDNTTRLQIIYGYENYDSYLLRLDLAHKGQGFIHYNNKSPGGIKCCLFSQEEYNSVVNQNPITKKFFQEYGTRYGLKEINNLNLSNDEKDLFEKIREQKEHSTAFKQKYSEEDVVDFINILSSMLPSDCQMPIDTDEEYARYCFNYDKIMFYATLLEIKLLSKDNNFSSKLFKLITNTALNYGLISKNSIDNLSDITGICMIIDEAKNRINTWNFI